MFLLFLFSFFSLFIVRTEQCIALGCLGFGGCGSSCLLGLCMGAPMIQPLGCPCGMGMACIRGGCVSRSAAVVAAGAKTFKDRVDQDPGELLRLQTPDQHFKSCCSFLDISPQCTNLCSYSAFSTDEVQGIINFSPSCLRDLDNIHFCAARGANHTECCVKSQVPRECVAFCDKGETVGNNDISYNNLQCVQYIGEMNSCFYEYATTEYYDTHQRERI